MPCRLSQRTTSTVCELHKSDYRDGILSAASHSSDVQMHLVIFPTVILRWIATTWACKDIALPNYSELAGDSLL